MMNSNQNIEIQKLAYDKSGNQLIILNIIQQFISNKASIDYIKISMKFCINN